MTAKEQHKGFELCNNSYDFPNHVEWWEAVCIETGCKYFRTSTKQELKQLIDKQEHKTR